MVQANGGGLRFIPPTDAIKIAESLGVVCKMATNLPNKSYIAKHDGISYIVVDESLTYIEQRVLVAKGIGALLYEKNRLVDNPRIKENWVTSFAQELLIPRQPTLQLYSVNAKTTHEIATMLYVTEAMVIERLAQIM